MRGERTQGQKEVHVSRWERRIIGDGCGGAGVRYTTGGGRCTCTSLRARACVCLQLLTSKAWGSVCKRLLDLLKSQPESQPQLLTVPYAGRGGGHVAGEHGAEGGADGGRWRHVPQSGRLVSRRGREGVSLAVERNASSYLSSCGIPDRIL